MNVLPPALLRAYEETEYHVGGDTPLVLRIGQHSAALKALHQRYAVACSAVLTAANPHSQLRDPASNALRQRGLAHDIAALGLPCVDARGQHPANGWPAEASFWVPGIDIRMARQLGMRWEQNAFVFCSADAVARLVLPGCGKPGSKA